MREVIMMGLKTLINKISLFVQVCNLCSAPTDFVAPVPRDFIVCKTININ